MIQFKLKAALEDGYKDILVQVPRVAIVFGHSCFEVEKGTTYKAEKFNDTNTELVEFEITGQQLFDEYKFDGAEACITYK